MSLSERDEFIIGRCATLAETFAQCYKEEMQDPGNIEDKDEWEAKYEAARHIAESILTINIDVPNSFDEDVEPIII